LTSTRTMLELPHTLKPVLAVGIALSTLIRGFVMVLETETLDPSSSSQAAAMERAL